MIVQLKQALAALSLMFAVLAHEAGNLFLVPSARAGTLEPGSAPSYVHDAEKDRGPKRTRPEFESSHR